MLKQLVTLTSQPLIPLEKSAKADKTVRVRGFASITGEDRHREEIDPSLFDLQSFKLNPQLWLNHELYRRPDTDTPVPIGVVEDADIVEVKADGDKFRIVSTLSGDEVFCVGQDEDAFKTLTDGDAGLWVCAVVLEPEPAGLVLDGRLNAFSWQGVIHRLPNGVATKIDLMEVSLVFVPANARATFIVGKTLDAGAEVVVVAGQKVMEVMDYGKTEPLPNSPTTESYALYVLRADGSASVVKTDSDTALSGAWSHVGDEAGVERVSLLCDTFRKGDGIDAVYDVVATYAVKAKWPASYVNKLPDASFAYIEPGGSKDKDGKTTPRSLRHLPYKDHTGKIDPAHVRNALARLSQTNIPEAAKRIAYRKLVSAARQVGIEVDKSASADSVDSLLFEEPKPESKGGEESMDLTELTKSLALLSAQVSELVKRMDAQDAKRTEEKSEAKAEEKPEAKAEEKPEAKAEEKPEAKAEEKPEAKAEEKPEAKADEAALAAVLDAVKAISESLASLDARMKALEEEPAKSKAATEEGVKKSALANKEDAKQVREAAKAVLPFFIVPDGVNRRHGPGA